MIFVSSFYLTKANTWHESMSELAHLTTRISAYSTMIFLSYFFLLNSNSFPDEISTLYSSLHPKIDSSFRIQFKVESYYFYAWTSYMFHMGCVRISPESADSIFFSSSFSRHRLRRLMTSAICAERRLWKSINKKYISTYNLIFFISHMGHLTLSILTQSSPVSVSRASLLCPAAAAVRGVRHAD